MPFYPFLRQGTLILTSPLEDLGIFWTRSSLCQSYLSSKATVARKTSSPPPALFRPAFDPRHSRRPANPCRWRASVCSTPVPDFLTAWLAAPHEWHLWRLKKSNGRAQDPTDFQGPPFPCSCALEGVPLRGYFFWRVELQGEPIGPPWPENELFCPFAKMPRLLPLTP